MISRTATQNRFQYQSIYCYCIVVPRYSVVGTHEHVTARPAQRSLLLFTQGPTLGVATLRGGDRATSVGINMLLCMSLHPPPVDVIIAFIHTHGLIQEHVPRIVPSQITPIFPCIIPVRQSL